MHVQKLYCEIEDDSCQRRHEVDMVLSQILCDIVQYIPRIVFAVEDAYLLLIVAGNMKALVGC